MFRIAVTAADREECRELINRSFQRHLLVHRQRGMIPPEKSDQLLLGDQKQLIMMEEEDSLVGTLLLELVGESAFIEYLTIVPERQGEGLGKRILQFAEARARVAKYTKVGLSVACHPEDRNIHKLLRWYEDLGYVYSETVKLDPESDVMQTIDPKYVKETSFTYLYKEVSCPTKTSFNRSLSVTQI
jgi:ribosomal protein S18 acetylase RimI-like enzyme